MVADRFSPFFPGRGGGTTQRTTADTAPPADVGGTTGSEPGQQRVPSPQTLVTALLTDSLLALTPGPRDDHHQSWRQNLPDIVTESVEGDGRSQDSPVKHSELSGSPPAGDSSAEETSHTFRVIKDDDTVTNSGKGTFGPAQGQEEPGAPVATSVEANETPPVPPAESGSPKFSEVVPERPIPVLITDTETDSDFVDSPQKAAKTDQQTTSSDRISGPANSADSFAKSPLGVLTVTGNSGCDFTEPSSPSSDADLSALSKADSPDRFWKLSPGSRSLSDFPVSPATSSGSSSSSSSPPAWDRSPSGSPPRRSPPSLSASLGSLDASRESQDSQSPADSPPPSAADDGYSLDDIEDALRDEPASPKVAPLPVASMPPSRPSHPSTQVDQQAREEQRDQKEQRAQRQQGVRTERVCPEEELAGFVEGQAARTERLRRRYAAAEDGGFIRRPSVRGVVIQQPPTAQQQQQQIYWTRTDQQQQQPRQLPAPASSQHSQLYRQNSAPLQPGAGQMPPPPAGHTRQQSAPLLPRQQEPLRQRLAQGPAERPPQQSQQQEQMYASVRPTAMQPGRPVHGQQPRQMAPLQSGLSQQPQPAQTQQHPVQMQPRTAPVQQQQPGPMRQQQSGRGRPQDATLVRSAHIPQMLPHQTPVPSHPQQSQQQQYSQQQYHQQQYHQQQYHQQQYSQQQQQQQQQQYHQQQQQQQYSQQQQQQQYHQQQQQQQLQQQQQQAAGRPLPMGQTRQQQLEQIRRLQSSHMVRVPAVTVGFPDESSRRQMPQWNSPTWLPGEGGGGGGRGGAGRERESFRTSRQRSASQQRLEAVGRPASLALPRAYEWPQERSGAVPAGPAAPSAASATAPLL